MADNKQYYYLKLKDNFFDSEEIKILESMENGYKYSNILLKMYLKSIKRDGLLVVNKKKPYSAEMIGTVTGHNTNDVKQALVLFEQLGLLETLSNGAIYMLDIQNFIGKSTTEADRKRAFRKSIDDKKTELFNKSMSLISMDSKSMGHLSDKSTPEIEIEIDKEIEIDNIYSRVDSTTYDEIISYLNEKTGKHYQASNKNTRKLINARLNEKFTIEDFKKVIDNKVSDWTGDMEKFLRPQTLFGTKFEGYLNENKKSSSFIDLL